MIALRPSDHLNPNDWLVSSGCVKIHGSEAAVSTVFALGHRLECSELSDRTRAEQVCPIEA